MCLRACETLQLVIDLFPLSHSHVAKLKTEVSPEYLKEHCDLFHLGQRI